MGEMGEEIPGIESCYVSKTVLDALHALLSSPLHSSEEDLVMLIAQRMRLSVREFRSHAAGSIDRKQHNRH